LSKKVMPASTASWTEADRLVRGGEIAEMVPAHTQRRHPGPVRPRRRRWDIAVAKVVAGRRRRCGVPSGRACLRRSRISPGAGGHHLGDLPTAERKAIRLVHEAVDAGITFFDNAWEYYNGKTENLLGRALRGRRDKVVLMTKVCTHGRSGRLALSMLEESLRRLQTDHLDVWQIHGIVYDNDPELAYAKGGVLEAFDRAKQQGKVRFVGFSGHKDPPSI